MDEKIAEVAIRAAQKQNPKGGWLVCVLYESGAGTVYTVKDKAAAQQAKERLSREIGRAAK